MTQNASSIAKVSSGVSTILWAVYSNEMRWNFCIYTPWRTARSALSVTHARKGLLTREITSVYSIRKEWGKLARFAYKDCVLVRMGERSSSAKLTNLVYQFQWVAVRIDRSLALPVKRSQKIVGARNGIRIITVALKNVAVSRGEARASHVCYMLNLHLRGTCIYVRRKVRIRTILGFSCANLGS